MKNISSFLCVAFPKKTLVVSCHFNILYAYTGAQRETPILSIPVPTLLLTQNIYETKQSARPENISAEMYA